MPRARSSCRESRARSRAASEPGGAGPRSARTFAAARSESGSDFAQAKAGLVHPRAAGPSSRPRPRTGPGAAATERTQSGAAGGSGSGRTSGLPSARSQSAQARAVVFGSSTVDHPEPVELPGPALVGRGHREGQPGEGRRLRVVGQDPEVGEVVGSGEPSDDRRLDLAEFLEAGEGRGLGQLVQEVDRGAVGELAVQVGERRRRRTRRTSTTARTPAPRPRAGRRSARCNTRARTGESGSVPRPPGPGPGPRRPAAPPRRARSDRPEQVGQADRPPAGEGGQEEEGRQEEPDAVVGRGREHPEDGQDQQVERGSRAAAGRGGSSAAARTRPDRPPRAGSRPGP